jgi:hypothetical protein
VKKSLDELISNAIIVCKEYEEVSPAMFQRTLMIDFYTGIKVFMELVKIGAISDYWKDEFDDEEENLIGKVDKIKLKEFLAN